jgi:hypothetical protein
VGRRRLELAKLARRRAPLDSKVLVSQSASRPRAWLDDLPPTDAFGTLIFQVVGQQLSGAATRTIVSLGTFRGADCPQRGPRLTVRKASPCGAF